MSLVVRNADGDKCVIGRINNAGRVKFYPEYQKLFDILYELGTFGTNGPDAGTTVTNFWLPTLSQSEFAAETSGPGFLNYTLIPDENTDPDPEFPFYFLDEGPVLHTEFSDLITEIVWESDVDVRLTFLTPPYGINYYDQDRVYPMLDIDNKLMIVQGTSGCIRTSQYNTMFIYADRACKVNIKLNAINPLEYTSELVGDIPVPTTLDICCVETTIAWSVLDSEQFILYTAAKGFKKTAAAIKNTIEYYSKPNPTNQLTDTSRTIAIEENKTVVIMQNIVPAETTSVARRWNNVTKSTDQYGIESRFKRGTYGIGGLDVLYTSSSHYPIVSCTLCIPQINGSGYSSIAIMLRLNSFPYYPALIDENGQKLTRSGLNPVLSPNAPYYIWGTSFALTKNNPAYPGFCIGHYIENRTRGPGIGASWKVKITFRARDLPPLPPDLWDPFAQVANVLTGTSPFVLPSNEMTVGKALLVGGGGGGGGAVRLTSPSDPNVLSAISGGGGGRGNVVQTGNIQLAVLDTLTNTYVNRPIAFTIGKGGAGGTGVGFPGLTGLRGEDSTLQVRDTNTGVLATGGAGSTSPNGADSGGGGGSAAVNAVVTYGSAGNAGQGAAGQVGSGGRGGKGGDGPVINFPTIAGVSDGGKDGTISNIPAGGGAGGILSDGNISYASGGTGGDVIKAPIGDKPGEAGGDGYIALVTRYVDY